MKDTLKWLAACVFILGIFVSIITRHFASIPLYVIAVFVCAPPSLEWIEQKTNIRLNTWAKYTLVIGLFLFGGILNNIVKPTTKTETAQLPAEVPVADVAPIDTVSRADVLRHELAFFNNPPDISTFTGSLEAAQGRLALFHIWKSHIELGQKDNDPEAQKLAEQLKRTVVKNQLADFPKLRKAYAESLNQKLWESDIDVRVTGKGNTILQFAGHQFTANRNIKEMHQILGVTPFEFRFKQVQYRWYKESNEYQYFEVNSPTDGELVELSR